MYAIGVPHSDPRRPLESPREYAVVRVGDCFAQTSILLRFALCLNPPPEVYVMCSLRKVACAKPGMNRPVSVQKTASDFQTTRQRQDEVPVPLFILVHDD